MTRPQIQLSQSLRGLLMKYLGFIAILLQCQLGFANTNLPALQPEKSYESYLDITKPEALDSLKDVVQSLSFLENRASKAESLINILRDGKASLNQWTNFINSFTHEAVYTDRGVHLINIKYVLQEIAEEVERAYKLAQQNHSHYYLKQTTQAHLEYMRLLKHTHEQLQPNSELYKDIDKVSLAIATALDNNIDANDKNLKKAVTEYANQLSHLKREIMFLKLNLDEAHRTHTRNAQVEMQHTYSSIRDRGEFINKAIAVIQNMANIAKVALNQGADISSNQLIDLIDESKRNLRPTYNQLMQLLDVENLMNSRSLLSHVDIKLKNTLITQAELLDSYLQSLQTNLRSGVINSKQVENKYHSSFYTQMQAQADSIVSLRCQMLF